MTTVGSLSRQYFISSYGTPDHTLYQIRGDTNTMILMCKDIITRREEPVLSVTMMSGTKIKPNMDKTVIMSKSFADVNLMLGVLREDGKPFYFALTNLTTTGPLYVQMFIGNDEKPLNSINIIRAGETIVVDSQCIEGVHKEMIATSHKKIMECKLGRDLTQDEDNRCRVDSDGNIGDGLIFKLCVIPTRQNQHTMQGGQCFWACMPYFLRREETRFGMDECDGPSIATARSAYEKDSRPYHAVLEHGQEVVANKGVSVDMDLVYDLAFQNTKILICILPDLPMNLPAMLPRRHMLQQEYRSNIEKNKLKIFPSDVCVITLCDKPDIVFAQCGHLCVCSGGKRSQEICDQIHNRCPLCKANIIAAIPRQQISVM